MIVQIAEDRYAVKWTHLPPTNTQCIIWLLDSDNERRAYGLAHCSSKDQYCKEIGRQVSLTKAIADFPKDIRQVFWDTYLNRNHMIATEEDLNKWHITITTPNAESTIRIKHEDLHQVAALISEWLTQNGIENTLEKKEA